MYELRPSNAWKTAARLEKPKKKKNPDGSEMKERWPKTGETAQTLRDLPILPDQVRLPPKKERKCQ